MIAKITEEVPKIIEKICEFFNELPDKLKEIGKNAIQGLINGIIEKWNSAKETVINFAHGIRDALANALNINSPSKVMRDYIGKNIALGIEQGFTDQMNKSLGVMQYNLVGGLTDLDIPTVRGNNEIVLNFYPQTMNKEELEVAFNYVNRRFGIAL